jgi:hypothetical protein
MNHNFYRLDDGELINIWDGELPKLTYVDIVTDMKFQLSGSENRNIEEWAVTDTTVDFDDEFYTVENQKKSNQGQGSNLWATQLNFRYSTNWRYPNNEWDYTFFLNTTHKINLSKNWSLSYSVDFNIKEKEIIRNKFSIYRPLHCWEFSFSYWPQGISSGFSLEINVKNPDLQDIRVISSDTNRSFGSY